MMWRELARAISAIFMDPRDYVFQHFQHRGWRLTVFNNVSLFIILLLATLSLSSSLKIYCMSYCNVTMIIVPVIIPSNRLELELGWKLHSWVCSLPVDQWTTHLHSTSDPSCTRTLELTISNWFDSHFMHRAAWIVYDLRINSILWLLYELYV